MLLLSHFSYRWTRLNCRFAKARHDRIFAGADANSACGGTDMSVRKYGAPGYLHKGGANQSQGLWSIAEQVYLTNGYRSQRLEIAAPLLRLTATRWLGRFALLDAGKLPGTALRSDNLIASASLLPANRP